MYNGKKVKPLNITLPKTSADVKSYDGETKWSYFFIDDDDLLKKYNAIWNKVSADIEKEFDSEPVYNKEFLGSNHTCLAVISLDSALKKNDNYYPQVFSEECKYIEKKTN